LPVSSAQPPAESATEPPARPAASERREQILRAARTAALDHGLAAVRMDEIAALARVSKGTLYNHFESKEDLLLAMLEQQLQAGTEIVAGAVGEEPDPGRALERTRDGLVEVIALQAQTASLLYQAWALVGDAPALERRLHEALRRFYALWATTTRQTLEAGQASGAFRPEADAEAFTGAMLALVSGFIFRGAFDPASVEPRGLRAAFDALLVDQLLPPTPSHPGETR